MNLQQTSEYNFKKGNILKNPSKRTLKNKENSNIKIIEKNLFLEIQSQDKKYKKYLTITPWGIEGFTKIINYEEGCSTFFGYETNSNKVR